MQVLTAYQGSINVHCNDVNIMIHCAINQTNPFKSM
jgi:hypothetical protein